MPRIPKEILRDTQSPFNNARILLELQSESSLTFYGEPHLLRVKHYCKIFEIVFSTL